MKILTKNVAQNVAQKNKKKQDKGTTSTHFRCPNKLLNQFSPNKTKTDIIIEALTQFFSVAQKKRDESVAHAVAQNTKNRILHGRIDTLEKFKESFDLVVKAMNTGMKNKTFKSELMNYFGSPENKEAYQKIMNSIKELQKVRKNGSVGK